METNRETESTVSSTPEEPVATQEPGICGHSSTRIQRRAVIRICGTLCTHQPSHRKQIRQKQEAGRQCQSSSIGFYARPLNANQRNGRRARLDWTTMLHWRRQPQQSPRSVQTDNKKAHLPLGNYFGERYNHHPEEPPIYGTERTPL